MEKRVLLATMLSLSFLFLWYYFINKTQSKKVSEQNVTMLPKNGNVETEKQNFISGQQITKTEIVNIDEEIIETENLKIVFNKYGAGIREIYIREKNGSQKDKYSLLCKNDKDSFSTFPQIKYNIKKTTKNDDTIVEFSGETKNVKVKKVFRFKKVVDASSWIEVETQMSKPQEVEFLWQHYIHTDEYTNESNTVFLAEQIKLQNKETIMVKKFSSGKVDTKEISWIGVSSKYFIVSIFPQKNISANVVIDKIDKNAKYINLKVNDKVANYKFTMFISPKSVSVLKSAGNKLLHTIDWGTFAPISKLFYEILLFFYKISTNFGIAIIGLTIVLQILTFPLTYNSLKSTLKMKQIQPQIQSLQKIYKDSPKELNEKIMNLYKEKKVNPFGGCLPLLLQIPIFWALFTMLRNTYDIRGAEFIWWIKDLSRPDKVFIPGAGFGVPILVVLMGITMFLQQISSGSLSDPNQKMFVYVFPILFTVMFWNFPSGLVLYWLINNIFTIGIQWTITKKLKQV